MSLASSGVLSNHYLGSILLWKRRLRQRQLTTSPAGPYEVFGPELAGGGAVRSVGLLPQDGARAPLRQRRGGGRGAVRLRLRGVAPAGVYRQQWRLPRRALPYRQGGEV